MILSHGTLTFPAAHLDTARSMMRDLAAQTRTEPGCLLYQVSENLETPGGFIISEQWESMDAMQVHLNQPEVGELVEKVKGMGVNDLSITAWSAGEATKIM
ncbi:antibiotic biosynthesis monooxygenase [Deinococcus detaillensis]|uniref:Antibiotic biosynthesis monooxygenase n=1 Tax=Deinococcus detaillensis TaxID=2592048 RepID=A0A553V2H2_9DEIO|nr:putative quinol monooxygenase [Deinococcus detaillensis]TSA86687.1 antibiotic biosynthesis monooxygenase [Deinococcus detaillensis]